MTSWIVIDGTVSSAKFRVMILSFTQKRFSVGTAQRFKQGHAEASLDVHVPWNGLSKRNGRC